MDIGRKHSIPRKQTMPARSTTMGLDKMGDQNKINGNESFFTEGSLYHYPPDTFNYKTYFDKDSFPASQGLSVIDWTEFTRDFESKDIKMNQVIGHIC
jgi:hypothetical protein